MNPIRLKFADSGYAEIQDDGSWVFQAPGRQFAGKASDIEAARAEVATARNAWILKCWNAGSFYPSQPGGPQRWLCEMK